MRAILCGLKMFMGACPLNNRSLWKSVRLLKCFTVFWLIALPAFAHDDFVTVIAAAKPSVVTVHASKKKRFFKTSEERQRERALGKYAEFYKDDFDDLPAKRSGSGFVVASNASQSWILTAAHVVKGSSKVTLKLSGGKKMKATLLHSDLASDVALLLIDLGGLPVLELSTSALKEGQMVLGIGAAFGLPVSSSLGIVSALNVELGKASSVSLVQTDVSVNPGSSGGALVDANGDVVGLLTKIYSNTGTFSGSSFAVPAAKLNQLLEKWLH